MLDIPSVDPVTPSVTDTVTGTTCTGLPVVFTTTVNPISSVNAVADQTYCNGAAVPSVVFTSAAVAGALKPEQGDATLTIFDEAGCLLFTQRGSYAKGHDAVTIDRAVLNTTGVLYYKLETAKDSATRKMIQTK